MSSDHENLVNLKTDAPNVMSKGGIFYTTTNTHHRSSACARITGRVHLHRLKRTLCERTSNLHTPGDFTSSLLLYIKLFSLGERSIDNVHPSINSKSKQQTKCPPSIYAWPSNHTETLQHKERRVVALHCLTFFFTFFPSTILQIVGVNE